MNTYIWCMYRDNKEFILHCNPVQGQNRARTGFSLCSNSHREKPVFITGNPSSHCRDHVFIAGIYAVLEIMGMLEICMI